jgi:hypothetical protein
MDKKVLLSTLWIFLVVNFIFCDVFTLHLSDTLKALITGEMNGFVIGQEFLLAFAVVMELAMVMIVLSRILPYKMNRIFNIIIGTILAILQTWTVVGEGTTLHYYFFSVIEIATCISIVWVAWKWKNSKPVIEAK